jgi:RNA polymerase sigma-70 factor (ECF subfamily)
VCISFYENLNRIDNIENWLRKVLYFKFVSFYKKSRSRQTFELNTAIHKSVDPDVSIPLDSEIVLTQLNRLSEDKRLIIRQRFWEGLKFQEIAENMNKSEAAVKKMFYRTLDELKNKF